MRRAKGCWRRCWQRAVDNVFIWFDEKIFTVEAVTNTQNDKLYACDVTASLPQHFCRDTPVTAPMSQHSKLQHPKAVLLPQPPLPQNFCYSTLPTALLLQHSCYSTPATAPLQQRPCYSAPATAVLVEHPCYSTLYQHSCNSTPATAPCYSTLCISLLYIVHYAAAPSYGKEQNEVSLGSIACWPLSLAMVIITVRTFTHVSIATWQNIIHMLYIYIWLSTSIEHVFYGNCSRCYNKINYLNTYFYKCRVLLFYRSPITIHSLFMTE